MTDKYFTAETTSLTIEKPGAVAIYAGDIPRENANGTTSMPLRGPLLLIPQDMWSGDEWVAEKVADLLNQNAYLFFDSAKAKP